MSHVRIAVRFSRGRAVDRMTHADALKLWEETLIAAGLPVELTEGRSARPRFSLAAPLPPGYTSDAEFLEVHLTEAVPGSEVTRALNSRLPQAIRALGVTAIAAGEPSLQSQLRWAEYRFELQALPGAPSIQETIDAFFRRDSFPWEEVIEAKSKRFDLRDLVDDLWTESCSAGPALGMRLDASATGTGRPDSVLAGLGIEPRSRQRTRLIFSYLPEAILLWRRVGRFEYPGRER